MKQVFINAVGVIASGVHNYEELLSVLNGQRKYVHEEVKLNPPNLLPANERRRSSESVRLALSVTEQVMDDFIDNGSVSAIFSSAFGDTLITHKLCEQLCQTPPMASPILFHNSVHNAPAGYWGIATQNLCQTNSIACGDSSFSLGLISAYSELMTQSEQVLLVCYDFPYVFPLSDKCKVTQTFACAFLLSTKSGLNNYGEMLIQTTTEDITTLKDVDMELLRKDNPAARSIPLLDLIEKKQGECVLDYIDGLNLKVTLQ